MIYTMDEWLGITNTVSNALRIAVAAKPNSDNPLEDLRAISSIKHSILYVETEILDSENPPLVLTSVIDWR